MIYLALACRSFIGLVFAVSAFTKLRSRPAFRSFAAWLAGLPGLPTRGHLAPVLAATEVAVAVLVALSWTWTAGLLLAAVTMAVLTVGVFLTVRAQARAGARASCQCFGTSAVPLSWVHVVRNAVLCTTAAVGAAWSGPLPAPPGVIALCLGGGAFAAAFVFFLDDLTALLTGPGLARDGAR